MAPLPGLVSGSYRGIAFYVPTASSRPGRRVARTFLPGVDDAAYDDFGRAPREISIDGLIIGDDYLAQAAALEAAFETQGPAMLVHPFRGPMMVILTEPATINYSDREMRIVRFQARFELVGSGFEAGLSGLFGIASIVVALVTLATSLSSSVEKRTISAARSRATTRSLRIIKQTMSNLQPVSSSRRFVPRLKAQVSRATADTPTALDAVVVTAAAMIGDATIKPWVSEAEESTAEAAPPAEALFALGVRVATALKGEVADAPSAPDQALLFAASIHVVIQAVSQIDYWSFESTDAALTARNQALECLSGLAETADLLSNSAYAGEMAEIIRQLYALQAEITGTVNEIIGRLPQTLVFETDRPVDAWVLANHVAGDNPAIVEAVYADIVRRNRPRHPAAMKPGKIRVIKP
ncbi:DNA circularization N-terminal domain-containing protein [Rhizobium sp. C1]|uniref:DNA circularization N-terminal domain-containing protein n=1 Tax=Rhizobium sp. C1 TaxID=1349799 RepID=UPI001E4351F0|nr:DNA circularization N-terminal domain-containing protein [Rhizobium sp. C1]MCD2176439.1 DNA circularization N-terminal domain-containing protein [Rhizobium sp. C1]